MRHAHYFIVLFFSLISLFHSQSTALETTGYFDFSVFSSKNNQAQSRLQPWMKLGQRFEYYGYTAVTRAFEQNADAFYFNEQNLRYSPTHPFWQATLKYSSFSGSETESLRFGLRLILSEIQYLKDTLINSPFKDLFIAINIHPLHVDSVDGNNFLVEFEYWKPFNSNKYYVTGYYSHSVVNDVRANYFENQFGYNFIDAWHLTLLQVWDETATEPFDVFAGIQGVWWF